MLMSGVIDALLFRGAVSIANEQRLEASGDLAISPIERII